jgi:hypothetical protein
MSATLFIFSIILIQTLFPEIFLKKIFLQERKDSSKDKTDLGEQ